jgi:hypothetical protein
MSTGNVIVTRRAGTGIDTAFIMVLCAGELAGLHTTYSGWWFLWVGLVGVMLGLGISQLTTALKLPILALAALVVVTYFVVGPAFLDRTEAIGGVLPSPSALHTLATTSVLGWKQLLTTAPPAPATGTLLMVPFVLGLVSGAVGLTLARRFQTAAAPLAAPVLLLAGVIALGTREPAQWTLTGLFVALLCLCWGALRAERRRRSFMHSTTSYSPTAPSTRIRPSASRDSGRIRKAGAAAVILAIATGGGALASPLLPGANGNGRAVLRDSVTPPLDLSAYPSPLAAFRKYTKDANQLWDQTLFTVTGLPSGTPVRIATLDDYDGSVWGVTNGPGSAGFQRVGSTINPDDSTSSDPTGPAVTATITIAPAYAAAADTNAWLPTIGAPTGISFPGTDGTGLTDSLRYNTSTSSGLVTTRLQAGDTITVRAVLTPTAVPPDAQPYGPPNLTNGYSAQFSDRAAAWDKGVTGLAAQLTAIASYLRSNGAYSDGGAGETEYLPGHSIGRLTQFLNGPQPVGDDEQYAAAFALIADSLGMPARVVLGAIPEADGVVKGQDVHAWVEIHTGDGSWDTVPYTRFMPDPSKKPDTQPPQPLQNAGAAVVPPPNTIQQPGTPANTGANATTAQPPEPAAAGGLTWLGPLLIVLAWILSPVLLALLGYGAVSGLKARRRRHRRTRGSAANRFATGWHDLIDHARDLGIAVPGGPTRLQQAQALALAVHGLSFLADTADAVVYGPGDPTEDQAAAYWRQIDDARRAMTRASTRRQRLQAAVDIRTLLRRRPDATTGAGAVRTAGNR